MKPTLVLETNYDACSAKIRRPKVGSLHKVGWWTFRTGVLIILKHNC